MQVASRSDLRRIISNLDPELFGVSEMRIRSLRKLGSGQGNINYLLVLDDRRFVVRMNIDPQMPEKSRSEFDGLKAVEPFGFAPRVYYCHDDPALIIIDYVDGRPFRVGQKSFDDGLISDLAVLLARIHRAPADLKEEDVRYVSYLEEAREYIEAIDRYTASRFSADLEQLHRSLKSMLPDEGSHALGTIHGDVCPQNLVFGDELHLIDWESVKRSDPARDVANVIIDFQLNDQLDVFLRAYGSVREDPTLLERARTYELIMRYHYVLWEVRRVFEIVREELPEAYLRGEDPTSHIREAKKQFRRLQRLGSIPSLDIDALCGAAR